MLYKSLNLLRIKIKQVFILLSSEALEVLPSLKLEIHSRH